MAGKLDMLSVNDNVGADQRVLPCDWSRHCDPAFADWFPRGAMEIKIGPKSP